MRSLVTTQEEMRLQTEPETARPQTTRAPEPPHGQPAPHTVILPTDIREPAPERPWFGALSDLRSQNAEIPGSPCLGFARAQRVRVSGPDGLSSSRTTHDVRGVG